MKHTLCEKYPNLEYFFSGFSGIWIEHRIYSTNLHIQSNYTKIKTRKNQNLDKFDKVKHAYFILVLGKQLSKILPDVYSA